MNINIYKNLNIGRDTSTVKDITETDTEMDKACRGFPVPVVLSQLSCPCCNVLANCQLCSVQADLSARLRHTDMYLHPLPVVLSWLSCPGCPVPDVLLGLATVPCPGCPFAAFLSMLDVLLFQPWRSCPSSPVPIDPSCCPVPAVQSQCPVLGVFLCCPVLNPARTFHLSYSNYPVMLVLPSLSCLCCPLPAGQSMLSYSSHPVLVLLSRLSCPAVLSWLSCPGYPDPAFLSLFLLLSLFWLSTMF